MDHFTLAALAFATQVGFGEHLAKALQPAGQGCGRDFKEEICGAFAGAGVDLPAEGLDVAHQAVIQGESRSAEEEQMLEKVREPRPFCRSIVAARVDPQRSSRALEPRGMAQGELQAVG
ncbi:hypothetical protein D3C78_830890 [compost metagenome]